ncbi:MAG: amidohydrolase family protein [Tissierellales bacterium]|nr:amidohydrolase family protein [Tissierellales bacterium]
MPILFFLKFGSQLQESRKVLIDSILNSNMTVGYGTDIVAVYNNYDCWREFKAWRDNGISALKTLKAATSINSEIVERKEIGTIEIGKKADIVAWEKDIINDHEAISSCNFVMKDGIIYKE